MADKDDTAEVADEEIVANENQEDGVAEDTQTEEAPAEDKEAIDEDAIAALAEGVKGEVTKNADPFTETLEEAETVESEEEADTESETVEEPADETAITEPETEAVPDPGNFQPGDYSFEIKTTDGKTVKISTPEDAENFAGRLDAEEGLISASQFLQFNRKSAAMDIGIAADRKTYDTQHQQYEAEQAVETARTDTLARWDKEINYMADKGDLPKISAELNSADWTNSEIAKDPAVKARTDLLQWTDAENNRRIAAGLDPISSMIDAHNAMQLEDMQKQQRSAEKNDRTIRQKRGAMVGSAAPTDPLVREGKDIVGPGGTLDDLITEFYNEA